MTNSYQFSLDHVDSVEQEQLIIEDMGQPQLSVVLPIYNEVESLPHLLDELVPALEQTGQTFEVICVDDGSGDGSFETLKKLRRQDSRLRIVQFRRNFGQTAAFAAGFDRGQRRNCYYDGCRSSE